MLLVDAPAAPSSVVRRLLVACHVQVSSAALAGTFKFKLALRLEDGDQAGPGRAGPGRLECHGVETRSRSLRAGGGVISHVLLVVASTGTASVRVTVA